MLAFSNLRLSNSVLKCKSLTRQSSGWFVSCTFAITLRSILLQKCNLQTTAYRNVKWKGVKQLTMKESRRKLTFQVFGILLLLHLAIILVQSVTEPVQNKLKNQLIGSVSGSSTLETFLEENREVMQKEVADSKSINSSEKTKEIGNKMKFLWFTSFLVNILITYLFSSLIVRFVLNRSSNSTRGKQ